MRLDLTKQPKERASTFQLRSNAERPFKFELRDVRPRRRSRWRKAVLYSIIWLVFASIFGLPAINGLVLFILLYFICMRPRHHTARLQQYSQTPQTNQTSQRQTSQRIDTQQPQAIQHPQATQQAQNLPPVSNFSTRPLMIINDVHTPPTPEQSRKAITEAGGIINYINQKN